MDRSEPPGAIDPAAVHCALCKRVLECTCHDSFLIMLSASRNGRFFENTLMGMGDFRSTTLPMPSGSGSATPMPGTQALGKWWGMKCGYVGALLGSAKTLRVCASLNDHSGMVVEDQ